MGPAEGRASARSALAGNPSDGYGGAMLSVELTALAARARAMIGQGGSDSTLVTATVERFARQFNCAGDVTVSWETEIPRSVGLAGSSAIVIAVTRALCAFHDVAMSPDELASFAHAVERVDLFIAGGRQDSVVQAYGGLVFMDFSCDPAGVESLDAALLPPLLVAWRTDAAEDSGLIHRHLRARYEAGEPSVVDRMAALAACAHDARTALLAGDHARFARAVDDTFDLRHEILSLDPRHVEMVDTARRAGAAANYTGSGGAIVAVCHDAAHRRQVAAALRTTSCEVVAAP
jgi:glucuronokinase